MYAKRSRRCILYLIIAFILLISGCKPSPALEEIQHSPNAEEADTTNSVNMIENEAQNKDYDDKLAPKTESEDSSNKRDREKDLPVAGDDDALLSAADLESDENLTEDSSAAKKATNNIPPEGVSSDNIQETLIPSPSAENQNLSKKTVNINGSIVTVPENVETVSAVGEAAVIVQMLGGNGRLVATSESFLSNQLVFDVFFSKAKNIPKALWTSNGSSCISNDSFRQLLELQPQVCFEISGKNTFTAEQVDVLSENNISYIVLPNLNTTSNIKQAVSIIGEVLGDKSSSGGTNAPAIADNYIKYSNSVISEISGKVDRATYNHIDYDNDKNAEGTKYLSSNNNDTSSSSFSGKYSLFISMWDDSAEYKIFNSASVYLDGRGAAVTRSGYSSSPLSYYMSVAGIINTAAIFPDFGDTKNWYVNPMIPSTKSVKISGSYTLPSGYYLTLTNNDISSNTTARTNGLGNTSTFPAIIAASQSIKNKILSDSLWKSYGYVQATNGIGQNFGFLNSEGEIIESTIIGDYDIYVNPKGIGSWSGESIESILEPIWFAWKFYGAYTEDEVKSKVKDFYSRFYSCSLSDPQLQTILAGSK